MNPIVLLVLAVVIVGLAVGSVINFGFGLLAIPILALFGWVAVGSAAFKRQQKIQQLKRFRNDARAQKIEFNEDDKKTIAV
jgi:uncharacterized membrane protein